MTSTGKRPVFTEERLLSHGGIKRQLSSLAHRSGAKRFGSRFNEVAFEALHQFLEPLLHDVIAYAEHDRQKTITSEHVNMGLNQFQRRYHPNLFKCGPNKAADQDIALSIIPFLRLPTRMASFCLLKLKPKHTFLSA